MYSSQFLKLAIQNPVKNDYNFCNEVLVIFKTNFGQTLFTNYIKSCSWKDFQSCVAFTKVWKIAETYQKELYVVNVIKKYVVSTMIIDFSLCDFVLIYVTAYMRLFYFVMFPSFLQPVLHSKRRSAKKKK